ncbi:GMP synthase [glutamine-hydrolyzing] [Spirochaetia bacterium]|nr:GMP synthase [glutamine-hydrolyzing] [Spirochaetia bacterium]
MDKILILDFGSQTTALIGRRIREAGVYTDIICGDAPLTDAVLRDVKGIILGGSPESVYEKGASPDPQIYTLGLPLLGICYGLQRMTVDNGGSVEALAVREYGGVEVVLNDVSKAKTGDKTAAFLEGFSDPLGVGRAPLAPKSSLRSLFAHFTAVFSATPPALRASGGANCFRAWMSHGDTITKLAPGFVELASSKTGFPAVVAHESKPWFGLQFHPEVTHSEGGGAILEAFVFGVCGAARSWTMKKYLEIAAGEIREKVGDEAVLLLISGGVDSTVAGAMLLKTLKPANVHLMYMDTGLMRKDETEAVTKTLQKLGAEHLHIIDCAKEFLEALSGKTDPELKRRVIGDLFIQIQEREVARLGLNSGYFLAQGTLYTDLVESGKGVGNKAQLIKSHHNVGSPLVAAKRAAGRIIEPLDRLYKDEVREMGRILGIEDDIIRRHPFPGPGLAVRIPGEVTAEKCRILREADAVFIAELKKRYVSGTQKTLYDDIWQAFAVLLPVQSVGVAGDMRKYGWVLALRAVNSSDGMTADVYPFPPRDLSEISTIITNKVPEIGRVCYDVSSKPPATIEWE